MTVASYRGALLRLWSAAALSSFGRALRGAAPPLFAVTFLVATAPAAAPGVFGITGMVWNVNTTTLMRERSPAVLLGRVASAFRTLAMGGVPLGALLGGAVATAWRLNTPPLLTAALFVLPVVSLIPALRTHVPVVAPDDGVTTARVPR